MLYLLRKYQKIIFWVVTVVVVMSFCFFGTYGAMGRQEAVDPQIGVSVSGRPILSKEFRILRSLLETSALDKEEGMPNLFNPGVIETDFLATGLGCLLARPYFAELKPELDTNVRKMGKYRPYVHPHSNEVGLEHLISMFSPALMQNVMLLKLQSDQATMRTFAQLSQLYMQQVQLPSSAQLRQFLQMQEKQKGIKADPALAHTPISLLGAKNLSEWFGSKFITLATAFIFNVAEVAREKGYSVSPSEAREELFRNIKKAYAQISYGKEASNEELQEYYVAKLRSLGADEMQVLGAWQKVMLFEKFIDEASHEVKLDSLPLQQLSQFAHESVEVDLYQLPQLLQFTQFSKACQFQLYLDLLSGSRPLEGKELTIPASLLSLEQLQRQDSELVQQEVTLEYRKLSVEQMAASLSLRETLDWQVKQENFEKLCSQFPQLKAASSEEARLGALEVLSAADRNAIDQFSREQMVWQDQKRLQEQLSMQPLQTVSGGLAMQVAVLGVEEAPAMVGLLKKAPLGEPVFCRDKAQACYQITVVSREESPHLLSFSEALSSGALDRALDSLLAKIYPTLRKKHADKFQMASGEWKKLSDVRSQVLELSYPELASNWQSGMERLVERVKAQGSDLSLVKSTNAVLKELALEKVSTSVSRGKKSGIVGEEAFAMQAGEISSVKRALSGACGFYEVKGRSASEVAATFGETPQELLAFDVKKECMASLVDYMHRENKVNLLLEAL